jgi:hypothetical protein
MERKTIIVEDMPKVDGERKSKMYLAHVCIDTLEITKCTYREWKAIAVPDASSEYVKTCFIEALLSQIDMFSVKIDYTKYVQNEMPSFTQKVEWLFNKGSCIYTKRGLIY